MSRRAPVDARTRVLTLSAPATGPSHVTFCGYQQPHTRHRTPKPDSYALCAGVENDPRADRERADANELTAARATVAALLAEHVEDSTGRCTDPNCPFAVTNRGNHLRYLAALLVEEMHDHA